MKSFLSLMKISYSLILQLLFYVSCRARPLLHATACLDLQCIDIHIIHICTITVLTLGNTDSARNNTHVCNIYVKYACTETWTPLYTFSVHIYSGHSSLNDTGHMWRKDHKLSIMILQNFVYFRLCATTSSPLQMWCADGLAQMTRQYFTRVYSAMN